MRDAGTTTAGGGRAVPHGLMGRTGRRPGKTDTRGAILAAAGEQFAARGYAGATIRGIAAAAGVDPALVHHYFGTKRELFVATLDLPVDPLEVVAAVGGGDPRGAGERLVRKLLTIWGTERGQAMMQSVLRSALTDEQDLRVLREFVLETVVLPLVTDLAPDRRELRANLLASQLVGLAVVRHVAQLEPLASVDQDTVAAAVAPTLQRYLTGELGPT